MSPIPPRPRLTSFAPQFLVDDLARSMSYYSKLGFVFGEPWDGFYAIGVMDGLEVHLKHAPKHEGAAGRSRADEHLDAAAGVDGIEAFYAHCVASGAKVVKPLAPTAWGTKDFYIEDPDGYVISFGGRAESGMPRSISVSEAKALLTAARPPIVLDVRRAEAFGESPGMIPGAERVPPDAIAEWAPPPDAPQEVVVYCVLGQQVSQSVAGALACRGISVRYLEGGIEGWKSDGGTTTGAGS